jgi:hypothetical protein
VRAGQRGRCLVRPGGLAPRAGPEPVRDRLRLRGGGRADLDARGGQAFARGPRIQVRAVQIHRHVNGLGVLPVARSLGQACHRRVPRVDAWPQEAWRVAAQVQSSGAAVAQQAFQVGEQPLPGAATARGARHGQQLHMPARARGLRTRATPGPARRTGAGGRHAGEAPETHSGDLRAVLCYQTDASRRLPGQRGQFAGVRFQVELRLAQAPDAAQVRGGHRTDDHG